jgi:hypothetical protein
MIRHRMKTLTLAALLAPLAGCHYKPTPVPLQASSADISALAGKWEGEYASNQTGRTGSITFIVQAGKDTAYGDVVLIPAISNVPITAADAPSGAHWRHSANSQLLRITLVRIRAGMVQGVLEPYVAPDCTCLVTTTFRGSIHGEAIEGDYLTTGEYGLSQTGKWRVTRLAESKTIADRD